MVKWPPEGKPLYHIDWFNPDEILCPLFSKEPVVSPHRGLIAIERCMSIRTTKPEVKEGENKPPRHKCEGCPAYEENRRINSVILRNHAEIKKAVREQEEARELERAEKERERALRAQERKATSAAASVSEHEVLRLLPLTGGKTVDQLTDELRCLVPSEVARITVRRLLYKLVGDMYKAGLLRREQLPNVKGKQYVYTKAA